MDCLVHNIAAAAGMLYCFVTLAHLIRWAEYPIATIPLGLTSDGRPMGMGVMAQRGSEGLMLQFMSAMEVLLPPRQLPKRLLEDEVGERSSI